VNYVVDAVVLGSIFTLFALGLTLSWGVLQILNLAHAEVFMLGAIGAYWITERVILPLWVVLPASMLLAGTVNLLLELLIFRRIRRRLAHDRSAELAMVIASVGAGSALVVLAENVVGRVAVGLDQDVFRVERFEVAGVSLTNIEVLVVAAALGIGVGLGAFVRVSRHGTALRALAYDAHTCGLLGVSENRLASATMFVSGALAGLAGVLLALYLNAADPYMGQSLLLKAFGAIIIGGVGSVWGAMLGAYLIAGAEIATAVAISASLRDAVAFGLILLLLLLRPEGLISRGAWQRA
jgi:branched-chain amino acid transport system permease protein